MPTSPLARTVAALVIFVVTLLLIMVRPRRLNEAAAALAGGAAMLLLGVVPVGQAIQVVLGNWDVFLFFLGLMAIAALAERSGFFDWSATVAARLAGGSDRRLFLNVLLLGAGISTLFSNDATALILTPIVYALVTRLRMEALPFMFACTFIADTASFVLPVSNPINILVLNSFRLGLPDFLRLLLVPSLVSIGLNVGLFLLLFRRQLRGQFDVSRLGAPAQAIRHAGYFRYVCAVLGLVAVGYLVAATLRAPLSPVALAGAAALLAGALAWRVARPADVAREISWPIFGFVAGMFVVVRGVEQVGLTSAFAGWLRAVAGAGAGGVGHGGPSVLGAVLVATFGSAIGANLINNVPMALVMTTTIRHFGIVSTTARLGLIGGTMFGCDLGPNVTTVGSLATILWMLLLRRRGLEVSALDYFKVGIVVAPLMLLAGALAMWGMLQL
jgi:arsenical pump membrane protein